MLRYRSPRATRARGIALLLLSFFFPASIVAQDLYNSPEARVQLMYVAYYGRPADPGGLDYWVDRLEALGGDMAQMIDAFGNSAEFTSRFGDYSTEQLVNNIYIQLLGRSADGAGLAFYTESIERGDYTLSSVAVDIAFGVRSGDSDYVTVAQKMSVADDFTAAVREGRVSYDESKIESVRNCLRNVTHNSLLRNDCTERVDAQGQFALLDFTLYHYLGGAPVATAANLPEDSFSGNIIISDEQFFMELDYEAAGPANPVQRLQYLARYDDGINRNQEYGENVYSQQSQTFSLVRFRVWLADGNYFSYGYPDANVAGIRLNIDQELAGDYMYSQAFSFTTVEQHGADGDAASSRVQGWLTLDINNNQRLRSLLIEFDTNGQSLAVDLDGYERLTTRGLDSGGQGNGSGGGNNQGDIETFNHQWICPGGYGGGGSADIPQVGCDAEYKRYSEVFGCNQVAEFNEAACALEFCTGIPWACGLYDD